MEAFFEDTTEAFLEYQHSDLSLSLFENKILNLSDVREQLTYMEFMEAEESQDIDNTASSKEKSKGVASSIKEKVLGMLRRIRALIEKAVGNLRNLAGGEKEELTAEEYINSDTGQIQLEMDAQGMMQEVDREYAKQRKLVGKLSDLSGVDVLLVEQGIDKLNDIIRKHSKPVMDSAHGIITVATRKRLANRILNNMDGVKQMDAKIESLVNKNYPPKDPSQMKRMERAMTKLTTLTNKLFDSYVTVSRTINKGMKKQAKINKRK